MKKYYSIILFFSLFTASINAQEIPNGGFEEWETMQGFNAEFPTGWITSNFLGVAAGLEPNAVKTTDAYQGTYAIKLSTVDGFYTDEHLVGTALYDGALDKTPSELRGYYKTSLVGDDVAYISIDVIGAGSFIGGAVIEFESSQSDYTYFSVPIDYIVENPDAEYFYLSILSSIEDGVVGTSITIDGLNFDGTTAVSDFKTANIDAVVAPNPVSDVLEISMGKFLDQLDMSIYDKYGKLVETKQFQQSIAIDVSQYPIGMYFIELRSDHKTLVKSTRFVVSR